jgi:sugar porter (SP) family MFS transporter
MMKKNKNKAYLLFITLSAALGGFLFGYDTAVISGTIGLVKSQFGLNTVMEGWFVSSALLGCITGVAFAGELSDRYGRKRSLIFSGLMFSVSVVGCALSGSNAELVIFRLLGGIGVGVASMLSPMYISEVSPARIRGRMVALYQFAITIGILSAYFANAVMLKLSGSLTGLDPAGIWNKLLVSEVWRGMFATELIPALFFFLIMFFVPSSPRWLVSKDRTEEAGEILERINEREFAQMELKQIQDSLAKEEKGTWSTLFKKGIRVALFAGMGLAILSQFTGINAIIYYGPRIMEEAGLQLSDALGGQVIIGIVNVLATVVAILRIDKFGRKRLMKGGITGMFFSLLVVGVLFLTGQTQGILLLIFILIFIASFALGYGPVIWVLLAEIYPTRVRGRAMSLATLTVWLGAGIIGQVVPWMLEVLSPAMTFFIFALCCIPVPLILRKIPETKGLSLEEIENIWRRED